MNVDQQIDNRIQSFLDELTAQESVTRYNASAGQVLVHRGHIPGGVFVVLTGDLALSTTQDAENAADASSPSAFAPAPRAAKKSPLARKSLAAQGDALGGLRTIAVGRPYLIPHPAELEEPAERGVVVLTHAALIHVPRSLTWLVPEIGDLIAHAPVPAVSLSHPPLPWLETPRTVSPSRQTRVDSSSFPPDSAALSSK